MAFDAEVTQPNHDRLLIQKARDRIADGWCQRTAYDPSSDSVCMMGAFVCALKDSHVPHGDCEQSDLDRLSMHLGFAHIGQAIRFNDWDYTTKDEVLKVFDDYLDGKPSSGTERITDMFKRLNNCSCPACSGGKAFKVEYPNAKVTFGSVGGWKNATVDLSAG